MIKTISAKEAADWLAGGDAVLIDVREPDEFRDEHIIYANSVPLGRLHDYLSQLRVPPNKKVIFQCMKGKRGEKACAAVHENSFGGGIYNLEGGIVSWKGEGLPVVRAGTGISIFRQVQIIVGSLIAILVGLGFMGLTIGFIIAGFFGAALFFAGVTGWCGLAMLLSRMPWNK